MNGSRRRRNGPCLKVCASRLPPCPSSSTPVEIAATFPVAVAALIRTQVGGAPVKPDASLTTVADFLRMLKVRRRTHNEIDALDCYFTAVCENGLGSSGFAGRVAISTKASLVSAIVAAYCAFTGPLHGGAPGPVLDMLDEIEASGDIEGWIERKLASGEPADGLRPPCLPRSRPRVPSAARGGRRARQGRRAHCVRQRGGKAALAALKRHKPGQALHQYRDERRRCCSKPSACRATPSPRCSPPRARSAGSRMRSSSARPAA